MNPETENGVVIELVIRDGCTELVRARRGVPRLPVPGDGWAVAAEETGNLAGRYQGTGTVSKIEIGPPGPPVVEVQLEPVPRAEGRPVVVLNRHRVPPRRRDGAARFLLSLPCFPLVAWSEAREPRTVLRVLRHGPPSGRLREEMETRLEEHLATAGPD